MASKTKVLNIDLIPLDPTPASVQIGDETNANMARHTETRRREGMRELSA